jgi:glycosyltransferase involved in cell wall biosynthesis
MRSKSTSQIPGALLKEATDIGECLEHIVLIHFHSRYTNKVLRDNVNIVTIPYIDPKTPAKFTLSILSSYFLSFPILLRVALKHKITLFRADDILISGLPCLLISKILKLKCLVSLHGDLEEVISYKIGKDKKILPLVLAVVHKILKFVIPKADGCIVVNKKLERLAQDYGSRRVMLTFPNIDLSIFRPRNAQEHQARNFTVLFVGRLEPEKGPLNILKVAAVLNDIKFLIAGYGSQQEEIEKIIKQRNLSNVKLLGTVNHALMPRVYHSVDVLVLPSYTEGMPIVMLEAMASEVPVIVSDVGAVGEILKDNNGGFAVQPGCIEDIVSGIKRLSEDRCLAVELGIKARRNVISQFNEFISTQIKLYQRTMTDRNY